jgi:isopentenyl diphosphate isomerase/L-lactate dehydrogenase-like FMN-dependent dehydrogenase
MPSQCSEDIISDACNVMTKGIHALGITHGFAKGDIKITSEGAKIGELAARLSGGFMSTFTYPLSTGVDLMKASLEICMGEEPGNLVPAYNKVSIERAIITKPGILKKISGIEEAKNIPGIKEIIFNLKPGDKITKPRSNVEKVGHIIAVADDLKNAEEAVKQAKEKLQFKITDSTDISLETIQTRAREKLTKICHVCKNCSGENCASGVPGMGGAGQGNSFKVNIRALNDYKINTRVIHDVTEPDTSLTFFGSKLSLPVMAAPVTGAVTNLNGAISEIDYANAILKGCNNAGSIGFVGDGASPEKYKIGVKAIETEQGHGIAIFKPRSNINDIIKRIKAAEKAGAIAVGIDIDAVVFKTMKMRNQSVGPKSLSELKEIIDSTNLPFILKGIMHPNDAALAVEAGAHAIIISNHGGRVLDQMRGTMQVLPEIAHEVSKHIKILIDGGFRNGVDILKGIAMGANAVLIGRPLTIAAVGLDSRGVAFYLNQIHKELKKAMILTGCGSLAEINQECVYNKNLHHIKQVLT